MPQERLVIVGGDAAGMSAASRAKRRRPDLEVEVFERGSYVSYAACGLPYFIAGEVPRLEDLMVLTPRQFHEERGIKVHLKTRVEKIWPYRKDVAVRDLASGRTREVDYDHLVLSTGAEPILPAGLDLDLPGVFTLRGLAEAARLREFIREHSPAQGVIVGTGYIGMEMAEALTAAGVKVTVLGRRPQVLPLFEAEIAEDAAAALKDNGVQVLTGVEADQVSRNGAGGLSVKLTSGQTLTADLVLVGAGVRPRNELAAEARLELGVKGAIKVDRRQRTSQAGVWAGGDCAEAYHRLLKRNAYVPLALTANRQGRVIGSNLVGQAEEFPGILGTTVCKVFALCVARTGLGLEEARAEGYDADKVVVTSRSRAGYYPGAAPVKTVLVVERRKKRLWGAQMVGPDGVAHRIDVWAAALAAGLSLEEVHGLDLAYAPPYAPVWDPILVASEVALKQIS